MRRSLTSRCSLLWTNLLWAPALLGCADGQIPELRVLNPWVREQWAEDEKYGPTYHTQIAQLDAFRGRAASLPPAERDRQAQQLAQRFRDEKTTVMRTQVLRALAAFPGDTAQRTLEAAATDADPRIRIAACQGLATRVNQDSLQALGQMVGGDTDLDVRIAAARALGNFPDPVAAQALGVALEENEPALQRAAMLSLRTATGKDYGASPASVVAWREHLRGGTPTPPEGPSIASRLTESLWFW